MYTSIYQNSYVVFIISLIVLLVIFYVFKIGYSTVVVNGKVEKRFNWKYPLAISLVIWVIWYFLLYPPSDVNINGSKQVGGTETSTIGDIIGSGVRQQKINMDNWL